jgi:LysM repeat protein
MAAKKPTTRKYRQAKQAAKPAAKAAFPGKKQAGKRDPKLKISLEDKQIADEVKQTAKSELGKKAYLSKTEYNMQQAAARARFQEAMREEFGEYAGKKASPAESEVSRAAKATSAGNGSSLVEDGKVVSKARAEEIMSGKKESATKKKPTVKKPSASKKPPVDVKNVAKVVGKAATAAKTAKTVAKGGKSAARAARSAANKAAWKNMTPEERKNWRANKPGAKTEKPSKYQAARNAGKTPADAAKRANPRLFKNPTAEAPVRMPKETAKTTPTNVKTPARPTDASLRAKENAYLDETKKRLAAKKAAAPKPRTKITVDGKTTTPAKPTPGAQALDKMKAEANAKAKAKAAKKGSKTVRVAKFAAKKFPLVTLAGEVGSVAKGSTYKDLAEINRLKAKLGDKPMSAKEGAATQASNLANLATLGLVGKTRRQRMDELNAKVKKQEAATAKANKGLRYGPGGESLVPGTAAYKAGSKTRPSASASSTKPSTKPNVGAGGSTTKYVVKKGDTLSGIAKNSGLSLAEVRKLNPELMSNPKYKKGAAIWSGTKVNVKKK